MTFGDYIKAKRVEQKLNQKELAAMLLVSQGCISSWERGRNVPKLLVQAHVYTLLEERSTTRVYEISTIFKKI